MYYNIDVATSISSSAKFPLPVYILLQLILRVYTSMAIRDAVAILGAGVQGRRLAYMVCTFQLQKVIQKETDFRTVVQSR